jgi:lysophospholipase L1-like esterase
VDKTTRNIIIWSVVGATILGVSAYLIIRNKKRVKCKDKVLFLGDSQTANRNSYVEKLQKKCGKHNFKKIAKVGAKSDWILEQYEQELANGSKYDVVSIMIGGNDIFARKSIDKTKKNLNALFDLAKKNKSKVLVISSPSKKFYDKSDEVHLRLADELEDWIDKHKKVDLFFPITKKTEKRELFASDNLHLNSKGQELVFNEVSKNIG